MMTDFEKFAMSQGIGTNKLDGYDIDSILSKYVRIS